MKTTRLRNELSKHTIIFDVVGAFDVSSGTESVSKTYLGDEPATDDLATPAEHTEINDLIADRERDPEKRAALEEARAWIARTVYAKQGTTLRTLRLRKGWSQAHLAKRIQTSQSHIARIENGNENLHLATCRRLCSALEIDMNMLDEALRTQETERADRY